MKVKRCDGCDCEQKSWLEGVTWLEVTVRRRLVTMGDSETEMDLDFCSWECVGKYAKERINARPVSRS